MKIIIVGLLVCQKQGFMQFFSVGENADGSCDCLHTLLLSSQYCLGESLFNNLFELSNKTFSKISTAYTGGLGIPNREQ